MNRLTPRRKGKRVVIAAGVVGLFVLSTAGVTFRRQILERCYLMLVGAPLLPSPEASPEDLVEFLWTWKDSYNPWEREKPDHPMSASEYEQTDFWLAYRRLIDRKEEAIPAIMARLTSHRSDANRRRHTILQALRAVTSWHDEWLPRVLVDVGSRQDFDIQTRYTACQNCRERMVSKEDFNYVTDKLSQIARLDPDAQVRRQAESSLGWVRTYEIKIRPGGNGWFYFRKRNSP